MMVGWSVNTRRIQVSSSLANENPSIKAPVNTSWIFLRIFRLFDRYKRTMNERVV